MDNSTPRARVAEWENKPAAFEQRKSSMREFDVGIDVSISRNVKVSAETLEEAKLKAKQIAKDAFETDLLIQAQD